jgi:protein gp37
MTKTKIEWTEKTWNPMTGCRIVSEGCRHCYATQMAYRLAAMGLPQYRGVTKKAKNGSIQWTGKIQEVESALAIPLKTKKPTLFFVNSMSDLFHEDVDTSFLDQVFQVISATPQHTYQILTKRAPRMASYFQNHPVPANVWLGVSVENRKQGLPRIKELQKIHATVRFLSIEPLLEDLGNINFKGIHWVIVGGESGNQARPMKEEWVRRIQRQCCKQQVKFFFKQWGTWGSDGMKRSKKVNGSLFEGKIWHEMPHTNK